MRRAGAAERLWKWRRRGRAQHARPPRLGNLAKTARFPHSHKPIIIRASQNGPTDTNASLRSEQARQPQIGPE